MPSMNPSFCSFKRLNTMIAYYHDVKNGDVLDEETVMVRGLITKKDDKAHNFKMYELKDKDTQGTCVKLIFKKSQHDSSDDIEFEEMHEDVEVGDYVKVTGYPGRSYRGTFCMWCSSIDVITYGNNRYETEEEEEEDDEPYVCSESSEEEEEEMDEDEVTEEEDEKSDDEKVENDEHPLNLHIQKHFLIDDIPMKVYRNYINYSGTILKITMVDTTTPFQVKLKTKICNFVFTKLDRNFIGIYVPPTPIEKDSPKGYDIIIRGKFSGLLTVIE